MIIYCDSYHLSFNVATSPIDSMLESLWSNTCVLLQIFRDFYCTYPLWVIWELWLAGEKFDSSVRWRWLNEAVITWMDFLHVFAIVWPRSYCWNVLVIPESPIDKRCVQFKRWVKMDFLNTMIWISSILYTVLVEVSACRFLFPVSAPLSTHLNTFVVHYTY